MPVLAVLASTVDATGSLDRHSHRAAEPTVSKQHIKNNV
jgi:hypothetical protein